MDSTSPSPSVVNYGISRISWRSRAWRILRPSLWAIVPLVTYFGIYVMFAQRAHMWGGGFAVAYPGLVRFYALSSKASAALGQSDALIEQHTDIGGTVRQFDQSLLFISPGWWHHLWRTFYAAERIELALRGNPPLRIAYSGPSQIAPSPSTPIPTTLPFLGPVYQDWFVRNGTLYRFVRGVYGIREPSNALTKRNDVYLFEWPLDGTWDEKPRVASRVRLVETNSRSGWQPHWMVDADHFITWNENTGEANLLAYGPDGQAATVAATIQGLRPIRCNPLGFIIVSQSGRYFAGEKDGLTIFRGDTCEIVRQVSGNAATDRFFQSRTDELNSQNSMCYLMDDGATLLRVVTIFKKQGESFINATTVVVFNLQSGEVRDIPIKLGLRADVHQAALVDGRLFLYLTYATERDMWKQCLFNPDDQTIIDVHPENGQPDSVTMGWDPVRKMMIDLLGFEANPQPLDQDSEVCIEMVGTNSRSLGKLRYSDATGKPNLFKTGLNTFGGR